MKCKLHKCRAKCCYNMPFEQNELVKYADKIVNPILYTEPIGIGVFAVTNIDMMQNKCPFLRSDYKCNIYDKRPSVCRKFGEIEELPCELLKK